MDGKNVGILPEKQDDRWLAAISHAMILFPNAGILITFAIWWTQREKSRYVAFQSLQAGFYQLGFWVIANSVLGYTIFSIFGLQFIVFGLALGFTALDIDPASVETHPIALPFLIVLKYVPILIQGLLALFVFGLLAHALLGIIQAYSGKPFKYIFLGRLLEKSFNKSDRTSE
jgi:uncharacterized Tic20 family protein